MSTRAKLIWTLVAVAAAIVGIYVVVVVRLGDIPAASAELPAAIREANSLGIPLTSAELVGNKRSLNVELTAAVLQPFELDTARSPVTSVFHALMAENPDYVRSGKILEAAERALDDVRDLSRKPDRLFQKDWDMAPVLPMDELVQMRGAANALCGSAVYSSHYGNFIKAKEDLAAARRLAKLAGNQPSLVGTFVAAAIESTTMRAVEFCLADASNSREAIAGLIKDVLSDEANTDLRNSLRSEAFLDVATCRNLDKLGGVRGFNISLTGEPVQPVNPSTLKRSGTPVDQTSKAYMARILQYWTKVFQYLDKNPNRPMDISNYMDKLAKSEGDKRRGTSRVIVRTLVPAFSEVSLGVLRASADQRRVLTLAKVLKYKAENGHFPSSLTEGGIDVTDPFDGKQIRYRQTEDGVRIWSIGINLRDDNGVTQYETDAKHRSDYDLVSRYPLVRARPRIVGGPSKKSSLTSHEKPGALSPQAIQR